MTDDKAAVLSRVDSEVSRDLYELELFAGEVALEAARVVRAKLAEFREVVMRGTRYMSDEYRQALGEYQTARAALLSAARAEIL
ncbi:hypothetical protein [Nocardioides sp. P5_E3]